MKVGEKLFQTVFYFIILYVFMFSIAEAKIPEFLLKQKKTVVTVHINDKDGLEIASDKGVVVDESGIIATECRLVKKWLEDVQNVLVVRTDYNSLHHLDRLISYNAVLDIALLKIDVNGLSTTRLKEHGGNAVVRYILKQVEIYRRSVKPQPKKDIPEKPADKAASISKPVESSDTSAVSLGQDKPEKTEKQIAESAGEYFKRGQSNEGTKKYAYAIESYKQAVKLKPDYFEAYVNLGLVYYRLAKYHEAIEVLGEALKIKLDISIQSKIGTIYIILGEYQKAVGSFKDAINSHPQNAELRFNIGIAYLLAGDRNAAYEEYIILNKLDKEKAESLFDLLYR
ncbi:MAG: tetratricopeptide repeat protein [Thermodesulfovibrionales bacterium]|nr:tetratricopeptide repeat protein [Thermodesulfovibrionales bacterium]